MSEARRENQTAGSAGHMSKGRHGPIRLEARQQGGEEAGWRRIGSLKGFGVEV